MSTDSKNLYIIIPALNEEPKLGDVLKDLADNGYKKIIVIDDGSRDGTADVAAKGGAHVVSHAINRGVGAATQTGFDMAKRLGAEYAITFDADSQHSASDITKMYEELQKGKAAVVIGSRFMKKNNKIPLLRRCFNKFGNFVTFLISGIWVTDSQSGFKGFNKKALEAIEIKVNGYECCSDMIREIAEKELSYTEVPIGVTYSDYSMKKGQNFATGVKTLLKLIIQSLMR